MTIGHDHDACFSWFVELSDLILISNISRSQLIDTSRFDPPVLNSLFLFSLIYTVNKMKCKP